MLSFFFFLKNWLKLDAKLNVIKPHSSQDESIFNNSTWIRRRIVSLLMESYRYVEICNICDDWRTDGLQVDTPTQHINGAALLQLRKYSDAIPISRILLAQDPLDATASLIFAECTLKSDACGQQQFRECARYLQDIESMVCNILEARKSYKLEPNKRTELDEASEGNIAQMQVQYASICSNLGIVYSKLGLPIPSLNMFEKAVAIAPGKTNLFHSTNLAKHSTYSQHSHKK